MDRGEHSSRLDGCNGGEVGDYIFAEPCSRYSQLTQLQKIADFRPIRNSICYRTPAKSNNSRQHVNSEVTPPLDTSQQPVKNEVLLPLGTSGSGEPVDKKLSPSLATSSNLIDIDLATPPTSVEAADQNPVSYSLNNFAKGLGDLWGSVWMVLKQNIYVLSNLGPLVLLLLFLALAAFYVYHESDTTSALIRMPFMHPPNATHMLLRDGRHLAYQEQGVRAENARFTIIAPNTFISSNHTGKLDPKISLMQKFGVRLITYDLPGFGKSDPHPDRNLKSAANDMLQLSYAMGVTEKFWVVGYSSGTLHAWAALKYIPERLAGAFMVSPMINPYEAGTTEEERHRTYYKWTAKRKFLYFLARRFPRFLPYFYHKSFLSANVGQRVKWLTLSLGKWDRAFIEEEMFQKLWQRDVEESIYQIFGYSSMEEADLQA